MRRGLKPPADLWSNVEILVARMCDRLLGKFGFWVIECLSLGGGGFI